MTFIEVLLSLIALVAFVTVAAESKRPVAKTFAIIAIIALIMACVTVSGRRHEAQQELEQYWRLAP